MNNYKNKFSQEGQSLIFKRTSTFKIVKTTELNERAIVWNLEKQVLKRINEIIQVTIF